MLYDDRGGYPPYPIDARERRLAAMERDNPQLYYDGYEYRYDNRRRGSQMPYDMLPPQQRQNKNMSYLKGRPVANYEEANAAMIDMDGSAHIFTDFGNRRIYVKSVNLDGVAQLDVYERVNNQMMHQTQNSGGIVDLMVDKSTQRKEAVSLDIIEEYINNTVQNKIHEYMSKIGGINSDVQSGQPAKRATESKLSKRSAVSESTADGSRKE